MRKILLTLVVGGIFLASCGNQGAEQAVAQSNQQAQQQVQSVQTKAPQAQEQVIENVTVEKFKELVENGACELIDVRTPKEYAEGHIKGAKNIDFYSPDFDKKISELPKDKVYCVYCRSGRRSLLSAQKMAQMGFKKIYNLQGGINAWIQSGNPVEK
ncbi:MAG: rhodanese-like domain-containing protein [Chlorobi bacterium]|nr:rhodanese-like domain-containing protein [Chlorobiota bacterium]